MVSTISWTHLSTTSPSGWTPSTRRLWRNLCGWYGVWQSHWIRQRKTWLGRDRTHDLETKNHISDAYAKSLTLLLKQIPVSYVFLPCESDGMLGFSKKCILFEIRPFYWFFTLQTALLPLQWWPMIGNETEEIARAGKCGTRYADFQTLLQRYKIYYNMIWVWNAISIQLIITRTFVW